MPDFLCQTLMLKGRALLASGKQEEALAEFQRMLELSVPRLLEDAENTDYQYFVYNAIGFTVKTLRVMDNDSKTKESFYRNEKYFEEIIAAYEGLLAEKPKEPENFEYIRNYLKALENIKAYLIQAKQFEKVYREILEKESGNSLAFDQIGHLYAGEGETEPAKHYYE